MYCDGFQISPTDQDIILSVPIVIFGRLRDNVILVKAVRLAAMLDKLKPASSTNVRNSAHIAQQALFSITLLLNANNAISRPPSHSTDIVSA